MAPGKQPLPVLSAGDAAPVGRPENAVSVESRAVPQDDSAVHEALREARWSTRWCMQTIVARAAW